MSHRTLALFLFSLILAAIPSWAGTRSIPEAPPGLRVDFTSIAGAAAARADVVVLPNVWLYVPANASPTPFLDRGAFSAVWSGALSVDIRSDYEFQAELNGALKLEINGTVLLETAGHGGKTPVSRSIRLNKGTNSFSASFRSPAEGDAWVRLNWIPKEGMAGPIPVAAFSCTANSPDLQKAQQLRLGRQLFAEHRCLKCHLDPSLAAGQGMMELAADAPSFEGIGSRRNYEWMARWISSPKTLRPTAQMPTLFHGPKAHEDSEAVAVFLASLKAGPTDNSTPPASAEAVNEGQILFAKLHCAACHQSPEDAEANPGGISLKHVRQKFAAGRLSEFLKAPEAHYAWIRMPNFKLAEEEALQLAAYLSSKADEAKNVSAPSDPILLERGKSLVQTAGCLNCHSLKLENRLAAKPLAEVASGRWDVGCLAQTTSSESRAPAFGFSVAELAAMRIFAESGRASLARHEPADFAERQTRLLNCRECHGKIEGFPALDKLGEKLKPEWTAQFIAGDISYKPRPWLEARMPAFPRWARGLAPGLAAIHGIAPKTPIEPPLDAEAAKVGQKLVSSEGGFSCIACHGVAQVRPTAVFEAPGINLAHSGERLLKPYFTRWLYSPLSVEPGSKMPVYFDEQGKSPLGEIYGGDGAKQIDAVWQYLRLGQQMPPPPGTQPAQ